MERAPSNRNQTRNTTRATQADYQTPKKTENTKNGRLQMEIRNFEGAMQKNGRLQMEIRNFENAMQNEGKTPQQIRSVRKGEQYISEFSLASRSNSIANTSVRTGVESQIEQEAQEVRIDNFEKQIKKFEDERVEMHEKFKMNARYLQECEKKFKEESNNFELRKKQLESDFETRKKFLEQSFADREAELDQEFEKKCAECEQDKQKHKDELDKARCLLIVDAQRDGQRRDAERVDFLKQLENTFEKVDQCMETTLRKLTSASPTVVEKVDQCTDAGVFGHTNDVVSEAAGKGKLSGKVVKELQLDVSEGGGDGETDKKRRKIEL